MAGVARFYKAKKNHIITAQTEHKCVLDSCRMLQQEGFDITYLPVQRSVSFARLPTGVFNQPLIAAFAGPEDPLA